MEIDSELRAALVAYALAHVAWKEAPDDVLIDPSDPEQGTVKGAAKRIRGQMHGKLLELGKLLAHKPP
jgi:hypothetical protein